MRYRVGIWVWARVRVISLLRKLFPASGRQVLGRGVRVRDRARLTLPLTLTPILPLALAVHPNGCVISGSSDMTVRIWTAEAPSGH